MNASGRAEQGSSIEHIILIKGNRGERVELLKRELVTALGDSARLYPSLQSTDLFDDDTEAALRNWQATIGLIADGVAGPCVQRALGVLSLSPLAVPLNTALVRTVFPSAAQASNISKYIPYVVAALEAFELTDVDMITVALAIIRAECESFLPITEMVSPYNTRPGEMPFSKYEDKKSLGNNEPGDGARFRGRGFVQISGRANYELYGSRLEVPLATIPDLACAPELAASLLAAFIHDKQTALRAAIKAGDLKKTRALVNGGSRGFARYKETYLNFQGLWGMLTVAGAARKRTKMTDKAAAAVAAAPASVNALRRGSFRVSPDAVDLRDREYMPPPRTLVEQYPDDSDMREYLGNYCKAGLILDQGHEGACTGFGLACVINYLRWARAGGPESHESVSPRMLYKFARRYDEYEGEDYDGSSCRGALKGWFHHGVCREQLWRYDEGPNSLPKKDWDLDAHEQTLGVYYRIDITSIVDMQAAISEVGAVFVSAYTHDGWDTVEVKETGRKRKSSATGSTPPQSHKDLPLVEYDGVPSRAGGHAFALVGFNRDGFIVQNSWGTDWGACGFAVVTYADWLANGMDAWVIAMGVAGVIAGRLASGKGAAEAGAVARSRMDWWDERKAYEHSIVLGNNGCVNHYHTRDSISQTLQYQACVAPDEWFRAQAATQKRLVIYVHGGLNSQSDAINRVRAMGRYFLQNGCYPLFMVWKSGMGEALCDILHDTIEVPVEHRGLAGNWFTDKVTDPVLEKTLGKRLARPLWAEMKENAMLASQTGRGADLMVNAIRSLAGTWGDKFELHLMGHSAGSIMLGRMLGNLARKGLIDVVKSCHLYAPACSIAFANSEYARHPHIMQNLYIDNLSDKRELRDHVAHVYQKSLLYFVSNALDADARTPILGMANAMDPDYGGWDGSAVTTEALDIWHRTVRATQLKKRTTLHDEAEIVVRKKKQGIDRKIEKASHGGFDNNVEVIGKTLQLITGGKLNLPVDDLTGF